MGFEGSFGCCFVSGSSCWLQQCCFVMILAGDGRLGAAGCLRLKPARWWWSERRGEEENEWRFWVVSSGVFWPEKGARVESTCQLQSQLSISKKIFITLNVADIFVNFCNFLE
ncbi:hypothetical protein H5410_013489 [Solanum commersonii]|uniref:Uncharacterized protein n=1 Tax=Solanum commersonii TaxID=4109 RepID=A0A9J6AVW6_SOLCO|nr:hypothetical protein H5410_013489 [Solanum commersonii]